MPVQPYVERATESQFTEYYPNRFQVSFEIATDQREVHVLPQFTTVEIMSSIGGLLFIAYIVGYAVFSFYANFHLENHITSRVYKNLGQLKEDNCTDSRKNMPAPWPSAQARGSVKVVDYQETGQDASADKEAQLQDSACNPISSLP